MNILRVVFLVLFIINIIFFTIESLILFIRAAKRSPVIKSRDRTLTQYCTVIAFPLSSVSYVSCSMGQMQVSGNFVIFIYIIIFSFLLSLRYGRVSHSLLLLKHFRRSYLILHRKHSPECQQQLRQHNRVEYKYSKVNRSVFKMRVFNCYPTQKCKYNTTINFTGVMYHSVKVTQIIFVSVERKRQRDEVT